MNTFTIEVNASMIKSRILEKVDSFKKTYYVQPRYIMLSEIHLVILKHDMSVYLYQDFKAEGVPHLFGMEICVSERVKTLDDIELF